MAGMMYNVGINFLAKNGVSPSLLKITADTNTASAAMLGFSLTAERAMKRLPKVLQPFSIGSFRGGMLGHLAGGAAFYGVARGIKSIVDETGRFEMANIKFTKLIGNAELASKTLKDMMIFASQTPFEFKQSQEISVGLLGAKVAAKDLIPTMRMLGDLAMGDPEKIERMAHAMVRFKSLNKVTWMSISPFATSGVPIVPALAKQLGVTEDRIASLSRAGKISAKDMEAALFALSKTPQYMGMMLVSMSTIPGLWSNFKDNIGMVQRALGGTFKESMKSVIVQMSGLTARTLSWIEANKTMLSQKIGGFFDRIAEGISKIDVDKLFSQIEFWGKAAYHVFWMVIYVKALNTALWATVKVMKEIAFWRALTMGVTGLGPKAGKYLTGRILGGAVAEGAGAMAGAGLARTLAPKLAGGLLGGGVGALAGRAVISGGSAAAALLPAAAATLPAWVLPAAVLALVAGIVLILTRLFQAKMSGEGFWDFLPGVGKERRPSTLGTVSEQLERQGIRNVGTSAAVRQYERSVTTSNFETKTSNVNIALDKGLRTTSEPPPGTTFSVLNLGSSFR